MADVFMACDAPDLELDACTLRCEHSLCPSGFQCLDGYCVRNGSRATCSGDGGLPEVGTGGAPGSGGGESGGHSGAVVGSGGTEVGVEAGLDGSAAGFTIERLPSPALCVGSPGTVLLTASAGTTPFVWSLGNGPFEIERTGAQVQVSGTPLRPGKYSLDVTVKDASDRTARASISVEVFERPRVATTNVPPACVGQQYRTELEATGGDPGSYRFSVEAPPQSTLATDGSFLTANSSRSDTTTFTVTVSDANCTSDPQSLMLKVDAGTCPAFKAATLPAPCKGQLYPAHTVDVQGGTGPYTVSAPSLPSGFVFDGTYRTVSGVSNSEDPLVLQVEDGAGHVAQQTFSMKARDTCWLAYRVTPENAPSTLHLHDPELGTDLPFPLLGSSESVVDYEFSPNGRFLAYRMLGPARRARLVLISAPMWTERTVDLGGDVTHYEWSPDSSILAAAYQNGDTVYLGGVRVFPAEHAGSLPEADGGPRGDNAVEDGGTGDAGPSNLTILSPLPASVGSDLVWAGNRAVAFHSGSESGDHVLQYATLGAQGFDSTDIADPYVLFVPNVVLRAPAGALVAIEPQGDITSYGTFDGMPPIGFFLDGTLDPQGHYVAQTRAGALELFKLDGDPNPVWARTEGCTTVLAWAPNQERLACLGPSGSGDTVRVLDVTEAPPSIGPGPGTVSGDYAYLGGDAFERRRAFSESANWFAFTTTKNVYVAKLHEGSPYVYSKDSPLGVTFNGPTDLAFSPDDHWLLSQRGTEVHLLDLTGGSSFPILLAPYTPPAAKACTEKFLDAPDAWCGNARASSWFIWSPDSQYVAAKDGSGKINRLNMLPNGTQSWQPVCDQDCGNDFTYQPFASTSHISKSRN